MKLEVKVGDTVIVKKSLSKPTLKRVASISKTGRVTLENGDVYDPNGKQYGGLRSVGSITRIAIPTSIELSEVHRTDVLDAIQTFVRRGDLLGLTTEKLEAILEILEGKS